MKISRFEDIFNTVRGRGPLFEYRLKNEDRNRVTLEYAVVP